MSVKYPEITVNVDEKLAVNKFATDEDYPHIKLKEDLPDSEFRKVVMACPAACYKVDPEGQKTFEYAACLECGTCRVLCGKTILEYWTFPQPTMGVEYRFG